jgi:hypothetical protein
MNAAAAAQAIFLNRLAKRDRMLKQLGSALAWANCALYAAGHEQLTWGDLATIIEKSAKHFKVAERFALRFAAVTTEKASHETWRMVLTQMREWDRAGAA